jgi:hypothetical protein
MKDLIRFYDLLSHLEQAIGGRRSLADCCGSLQWPERGVSSKRAKRVLAPATDHVWFVSARMRSLLVQIPPFGTGFRSIAELPAQAQGITVVQYSGTWSGLRSSVGMDEIVLFHGVRASIPEKWQPNCGFPGTRC